MRAETGTVSIGIVRPVLKLQYVQHGAPGNSYIVLLHCLQLRSAAWSRVLFEELRALMLAFMKPECSSPCLQQPTAVSRPVCVCSIRCTAVYCYDIPTDTHLLLWYTNRHTFTAMIYQQTHIYCYDIPTDTHLLLRYTNIHTFTAMIYQHTHIYCYDIPTYTHLLLWYTNIHTFTAMIYQQTHIYCYDIPTYAHLLLWYTNIHTFTAMIYQHTCIYCYDIPTYAHLVLWYTNIHTFTAIIYQHTHIYCYDIPTDTHLLLWYTNRHTFTRISIFSHTLLLLTNMFRSLLWPSSGCLIARVQSMYSTNSTQFYT